MNQKLLTLTQLEIIAAIDPLRMVAASLSELFSASKAGNLVNKSKSSAFIETSRANFGTARRQLAKFPFQKDRKPCFL